MRNKTYHFPGFSIIVPGQIRREVEIVPIEMPEGIPEDIPENTENFTLIRYIANIALFRKDDFENEDFENPVLEFDPPIELRINYRSEDTGKADGDIHHLKLA